MSEIFSSTELSEIICTRLSHDLIGNIGAVANAVELLDDDPDCVAEIKPILEISAKTLTARLKFFRLAFGIDNTGTKNIPELEQLINAYLATVGSRNFPITLKLNITTPQLHKIILPAVMALADVFIRGGELNVTQKADGIEVSAVSNAALSESKLSELQKTITGALSEEKNSQTAPMMYLKKLLENKNVNLNLKFTSTQAILDIA